MRPRPEGRGSDACGGSDDPRSYPDTGVGDDHRCAPIIGCVPRSLEGRFEKFSMIFGQDPNLLGDNLLAWLTLAIGGALFAGTALALLKPLEESEEGQLTKAPLGRSLIQMVIGFLASAWALATLLA